MRSDYVILRAGVVSSGLLFGSTAATADVNANRRNPVDGTPDATSIETRDVNQRILDCKIRSALLKNLSDGGGLSVTVHVHGTSVALSGEVPDRASKRLAFELASAVEGVTSVKSIIEVAPRDVTAKVPQQGDIQARVKNAIMVSAARQPLLEHLAADALAVTVFASNGVVVLGGHLADASARNAAVGRVLALPNVERVEDQMTATP